MNKTNITSALATLAVVTTLLAGVAVTPVSAATTSDCGVVSDVLGQCEDGSNDVTFASAKSYALGFADRITHSAASLASEDKTTTADTANALQDKFNNNSADIVSYANNRTTASTDLNVIRLTIEQDGERVSKYLVAPVNNSSFESASIVDSTSRDVDSYVVISGYAAENAPDELDAFVSDYVKTGETPSKSYLAGLHGKYGSDISGNLLREVMP